MVDWLAPGQLIQTGIKAIVSDIFGAYADKRDVMAALYPKSEITGDYSNKNELWIDYAADLGDGFDATYTVAWLLAKKQLAVRYGEQTLQLPRGDVLVMGGDQVYPTASFDEYSNRLLKPYEAALPHVPAREAPDLYAIPGNHDWYDGLSNFSRIFCQKKWVGGWKTQQRRSYFAVKLPHNWWLWGIDIQLEGFIDEPQLRYFYEIGKHEVQDGDRVILCTAEPSWVYGVTKGAEAFASLRYFEDRYIRNAEIHKARLAVTLTGDLHHYVRYESQDAGRRGAEDHRRRRRRLPLRHPRHAQGARARRGVQGERPPGDLQKGGELPRYPDLHAADLRQPAHPDPELEVRIVPERLLHALQLDPAERQQDPAGPPGQPSVLDGVSPRPESGELAAGPEDLLRPHRQHAG